MKIVHLSDLHIGKKVNEFSMLEDQKFILTRIINIIDEEKADAVIIAGDVYDKSIPSAEAVQCLDDFVFRLAQRGLQVFIISGNHDSAERLSFASRLIDLSGVHISRVYDGNLEPITLSDEYGRVNFYMLPFIKPIYVRAAFPEKEIDGYTEAISCAVNSMNIDESERNVLISHQFVTGASRSDSEEISVGGTDNVDASAYSGFDYVALGHIHGPQNIGSEHIRYCGTPLKYSFSEKDHIKSVSIVELGAKGTFELRTVPLEPKHDMREIRGSYEELMSKSFYEGTAVDDYLRIILTDEDEVMDAMLRLRTVYPNVMKLEYDNTRTRVHNTIGLSQEVERKTPMELMAELYELQNGRALDEYQSSVLQEMIERIWGNEQ